MRAQTTAPDAVKEAVPGRLRELGMALAARGLDVRLEVDRWCLTAINKAPAPDDPTDPLAVAFGPIKLVQRVHLAVDDEGALCWYWQWSGPTRESAGEYELLGAAAAIHEAAERIARVLALRDEPAGAVE